MPHLKNKTLDQVFHGAVGTYENMATVPKRMVKRAMDPAYRKKVAEDVKGFARSVRKRFGN